MADQEKGVGRMERTPEKCAMHGYYALPVCWECRTEERREITRQGIQRIHGDRLTLEKIKLGIVIPMHDIEANLTRTVDTQLGLTNFKAFILGMPDEEIHVVYPRDWIQAVKHRFAPMWILKRWPIEWTEIREKRFEKVFLSLHPEKTIRIEGEERSPILPEHDCADPKFATPVTDNRCLPSETEGGGKR